MQFLVFVRRFVDEADVFVVGKQADYNRLSECLLKSLQEPPKDAGQTGLDCAATGRRLGRRGRHGQERGAAQEHVLAYAASELVLTLQDLIGCLVRCKRRVL